LLCRDKREAVDVTLADFDGVTFHITNDPNNKAIIFVSLHWRCANDLLKNGGDATLQAVYGDLIQAKPEQGYEVTLALNLDSTPNIGTLVPFL
jgi:actin related protein 2/3 complex subunit 2